MDGPSRNRFFGIRPLGRAPLGPSHFVPAMETLSGDSGFGTLAQAQKSLDLGSLGINGCFGLSQDLGAEQSISGCDELNSAVAVACCLVGISATYNTTTCGTPERPHCAVVPEGHARGPEVIGCSHTTHTMNRNTFVVPNRANNNKRKKKEQQIRKQKLKNKRKQKKTLEHTIEQVLSAENVTGGSAPADMVFWGGPKKASVRAAVTIAIPWSDSALACIEFNTHLFNLLAQYPWVEFCHVFTQDLP